MEKIKLFINKNPNLINIILGIIGFTIAGIVYYDFEIMLKVFVGVVIFSVVIGLISFAIKIFLK
ncbi:MAG: hypothetical protein COZ75_02905 [Flavobacteriaceae bacterium CG_4_8_14_3_um_filter_34_10]|nr:hypothetical protein [Flavobacteriia bacterium]PIV48365.1 MAG: hypothetical protein COS19_14185 [Flavobacteriaceae bacterium CG02_land_8_20_14_3_00_34_13]PIX10181.1 MAG: hypothetical protein COZ75_02905 [Flavobacteriaceae bacterium CG_4_8_14_3_um_filter_34_10]PJC07565.1 MAG: hypothetical protein CO068_05435 [Flavobacteriaceae bacterium CG_4_9_14_0_8_um_filter_34_30]